MLRPRPNTDWIFGYGSVIHNPGFEYGAVVRPAYIKGWRRVFWQGSTDHRGVPEAPGRTVTLEKCPNSVTWGAAFQLAGDAEQRAKTWEYLEWREKQYDRRELVEVFAAGSEAPAVTALTYIATPNRERNPNYLGPAPLGAIADQIATAAGPSGPNFEYLFKLADAMREFGVHNDTELFELEVLVRSRLEASSRALAAASAACAPQWPGGTAGSGGSSSGDEQEEAATEVSVSSGA